MSNIAEESVKGHGFGPMPVFLAGISTILGAIMFLRFGYAVGHLGLLGAVGMIVVGHLVTIPTALALSEIATNRRVEGGGEYFIVSRSFGLRIGTAIGAALYLSQAVSIAFYCIALGEAATPLAGYFENATGYLFDVRMVSIPAILGLGALMFAKGADMGVKVLYVVACVLTASLVLFFLGDPVAASPTAVSAGGPIDNADAFFVVFAVCFPGFTGMTAGVGLSGDLAKPRRAIPIGTMAATAAGLLIYIAIVWKLDRSASPTALAEDQLIMAKIALWGPIIPIGLACAALSSAIGSILVAPRTIQALTRDGCLPLGRVNRMLGKGVGEADEPRTATLVTAAFALVFVAFGDVNVVARLISMFFMVTYGSLCAISFLEHFAGNPSYRPGFRSRWYVSLFGALMCGLMMFQMDPAFALFAILALVGLYALTALSPQGKKEDGLAVMFHGVMSQATRFMHVKLQRDKSSQKGRYWRPSIIYLDSQPPAHDRAGLKLLSWLCAKYGFGTYIHRIDGMLDEKPHEEVTSVRDELISLVQQEFPAIFTETMVSPSDRTALAQALQVPGISGMENNTVLFSCPRKGEAKDYQEVVNSALFASATEKNLLILREDDPTFGNRREVHVWITWHDAKCANLMLLLAYILVAHPDWRDAEIRVFAAFPSSEVRGEEADFVELLEEGRIPIGKANVSFLPINDGQEFRDAVERASRGADLVLMGLPLARLEENGADLLSRHETLPNMLFVTARDVVRID